MSGTTRIRRQEALLFRMASLSRIEDGSQTVFERQCSPNNVFRGYTKLLAPLAVPRQMHGRSSVKRPSELIGRGVRELTGL